MNPDDGLGEAVHLTTMIPCLVYGATGATFLREGYFAENINVKETVLRGAYEHGALPGVLPNAATINKTDEIQITCADPFSAFVGALLALT